MQKPDYSGKPDSCICGVLPVPHSHLMADKRSSRLKPDIRRIINHGTKEYPVHITEGAEDFSPYPGGGYITIEEKED